MVLLYWLYCIQEVTNMNIQINIYPSKEKLTITFMEIVGTEWVETVIESNEIRAWEYEDLIKLYKNAKELKGA